MSFYIGKTKLPIFEADSITVSKNRESTNVPILNGDTITIMGKKGLTQIDYSSFFPSSWGSYCDVSRGQLKKPNQYKRILEELRDNENFFMVRISELKLNVYCKIKELVFGLENGVGDISYSMSLEEYNKLTPSPVIAVVNPIQTNIPQVEQAPVVNKDIDVNGAPRETKETEAREYVVQEDDCIYTIGMKFNMDWRDIYNDNKSIIGNDPNILKKGQKLKIRGNKKEQNKKILKLSSGREVVVNHSDKSKAQQRAMDLLSGKISVWDIYK